MRVKIPKSHDSAGGGGEAAGGSGACSGTARVVYRRTVAGLELSPGLSQAFWLDSYRRPTLADGAPDGSTFVSSSAAYSRTFCSDCRNCKTTSPAIGADSPSQSQAAVSHANPPYMQMPTTQAPGAAGSAGGSSTRAE